MHTYVSNLRRTLGDVVLRQGDGYLLRSIGSTTDVSSSRTPTEPRPRPLLLKRWPADCATPC